MNVPKTAKALIIMAHGSRNSKANTEFLGLVDELKNQESLNKNYHAISPCFLELSSPSLLDASKQLNDSGIDTIDLYPMFFNQGNHVTKDIPKQIEAVVDAYPHIKMLQLDYFGLNHSLANNMAKHIELQNQ